MATIYVRSTDGVDTDNGSTWALAKATLTGAAAIDAAGDNIYVSQAHAESTGSAVTLALAGTIANPVKIVAVSDSAEPPTAVSEAPTVTTTTGDITINGAAYVRGINFKAAGSVVLNGGNDSVQQVYDKCQFRSNNASSAGQVKTGAGANFTKKVLLKDCSFFFSQTTQQVLNAGVDLCVEGGLLAAGSVSPANMFASLSDRTFSRTMISGIDLSNAAAGINIFSKNNTPAASAGLSACLNTIRNSRLPASWSGAVVNGVNAPGQRYEMHNCASGAQNFRYQAMDYFGSINDDTTVIKSGGSTDGVTQYSMKMVTLAAANYPAGALVSPELPAVWNATTGSAKTVTVEIVHDSATALTDSEVWLEVQYLSDSGNPIGTYISDAKSSVLASSANQTSSAAAWTTTGLTTPNKQKLEVTFTPQMVGYIQAKIYLAKPSKTIYYDNKLTVA